MMEARNKNEDLIEDAIMDHMDDVWYKLTQEEIDKINHSI